MRASVTVESHELVLPAATMAESCSRYSEDGGTSPECQERADNGMGLFLVAALVLLAIGWGVWRLMVRRIGTPPDA